MKRLFAVCCALFVVGTWGCSDDGGNSSSCSLTVDACVTTGKYLDTEKCECADLSSCILSEETCANLGRTLDTGTCTCKEKAAGCTLSADICKAMDKMFDASNCACIGGSGTCDKSQATCAAEGKTFDAANCACVGGSGTCDKSQATCAAEGKMFDASNCACVEKACDKSETSCASEGKKFDAGSCACVDAGCDKSTESCGAEGKDFDAEHCACVEKACDKSETSCASEGKKFDAGTCACVGAECDKSTESCGAEGKDFDAANCKCVEKACDKSTESCGAEGKDFDAEHCACVEKVCDKSAAICAAEGKDFDAGSCACVEKGCDKSTASCAADGKDFDAEHCTCVEKACDKSAAICGAEGKDFDAANCKCVEKACDKNTAICAAEGKDFDSEKCACVCGRTEATCAAEGRGFNAAQCKCTDCTANVCKDGNFLKECTDSGAYHEKKCDYGCANGSCKPNPNPGCTENACKNSSTLLLCAGGKYSEVPCDYGCSESEKGCKSKSDDDECSVDVCKNSTILKECVGGKYSERECPNGCELGVCKTAGQITEPTAGAACSESYDGGCSSDRKKRYYCGPEGKLIEKVCTGNTACVVMGNNSSQCIDESAATCTKETYDAGCSSDKSVGTFCSSAGRVVTLDCKSLGRECKNSSGYIQCVDLPSNCAPGGTSYCIKVCKSDGSEGYYYSKGEVHTVVCSNKDCTTENGRVECLSDSQQPGVPGEGECDPNTYEGGCSEDGQTRYYCGSDYKFVSKTCETGTRCVVKGGNRSSCEKTPVSDCAPGGTTYCNKVCKPDGSEGYYYSKGEVHTVVCAENDCTVANGRVECLGDANQVPDEPVAGDACESETYMGGCSSDKKTRFYCAGGQLVAKTCEANQECEVKGNNSSVCVGGGSSLPDDIPETCTHHVSKGICSTKDHMPYVCGSAGEYYKLNCSKTCFECPDNYWVGCGDSLESVCADHMGAE